MSETGYWSHTTIPRGISAHSVRKFRVFQREIASFAISVHREASVPRCKANWQKPPLDSDEPQDGFAILLKRSAVLTGLNMCGCLLPQLPYLCTLAPAPPIMASTSFLLAIVVSPGVVMASAPWAAP